MQAYAILLLCVFFLMAETTRNVTDDKSLFIKLMDLHAKHCATASLCAFRTETGHSPHQNICCTECSCTEECTELGTCCPDYHLLGSIGNYVSYNASEYFERIKSINLDTEKHEQCIKTREHYKFGATGFKMVASCPLLFQGDTEIRNKCAEPGNTSIPYPEMFVPVTSFKTKTTYRNIYCLKCNEDEDDISRRYRYWSTIMYCRNPHHGKTSVVAPGEFIEALVNTNTRIEGCRLEFVPDGILKSVYSDKYCDVVDFETCPMGSDKQLDEICRSFHLPVKYSINATMVKSYKNIACYLCRAENTFNSYCRVNISKPMEYGLEILLNGTVKEYTEDQVLDVKVFSNTVTSCDTGFVGIMSNDGKVKCARVLCPLNFFPLKGDCHPTFLSVRDAHFTAMLDVRRPQIYGQQTLNIIRKNYMKTVSEIASFIFGALSWGLWEIDNTYDVLAISFTGMDTRPLFDIMTNFQYFLNRICTVDIVTKTDSIRISISQSRNPKISFKSMSTIKPKPKQILPYKEIEPTSMMIGLFNTHLCYRVSVPMSEKKYYTENRLNEESIEYTKSGDLKVCIDDVVDNITDRKHAYRFTKTCVQTTDDYMRNIEQFKTGELVVNKKTRNNDKINKMMVTNENVRTLSNPDDAEDETVSDPSKALFAVGIILAVVVVVVGIPIIRKKKQHIEFDDELDEQVSIEDT